MPALQGPGCSCVCLLPGVFLREELSMCCYCYLLVKDYKTLLVDAYSYVRQNGREVSNHSMCYCYF